jgi:hypothetical protein
MSFYKGCEEKVWKISSVVSDLPRMLTPDMPTSLLLLGNGKIHTVAERLAFSHSRFENKETKCLLFLFHLVSIQNFLEGDCEEL